MSHVSYEESSKGNWGCENGTNDLERLKFGLMIRMTKALEAMSGNFLSLQRDVVSLKESRDRSWEREHHLERKIAGLRGALTKAKRKP